MSVTIIDRPALFPGYTVQQRQTKGPVVAFNAELPVGGHVYLSERELADAVAATLATSRYQWDRLTAVLEAAGWRSASADNEAEAKLADAEAELAKVTAENATLKAAIQILPQPAQHTAAHPHKPSKTGTDK